MASSHWRPSWLLLVALVCVAAIGGALARGPGGAGMEVVVVLSSDAAPYKAAEAGLRAGLKGAAAEVRSVELGSVSAEAVRELAAGPGRVVVAVGTDAAARLRAMAPGQAFLYCMVSGTDGAGSAGDVRVEGVTTDIPLAEQVALIREAFPGARTIGCLYRADDEKSRRRVDAMRAALPPGLELRAVDLAAEPSVAAGVKSLVGAGPQVIWTVPDGAVYNAGMIRTLLKESLGAGVPVFGFSTPVVRAGALLGVGILPEDQGSQVAELVRARLTGAWSAPSVARAPIDPRARIAINKVVAERLGIRVPRSLMERADDVFDGGE